MKEPFDDIDKAFRSKYHDLDRVGKVNEGLWADFEKTLNSTDAVPVSEKTVATLISGKDEITRILTVGSLIIVLLFSFLYVNTEVDKVPGNKRTELNKSNVNKENNESFMPSDSKNQVNELPNTVAELEDSTDSQISGANKKWKNDKVLSTQRSEKEEELLSMENEEKSKSAHQKTNQSVSVISTQTEGAVTEKIQESSNERELQKERKQEASQFSSVKPIDKNTSNSISDSNIPSSDIGNANLPDNNSNQEQLNKGMGEYDQDKGIRANKEFTSDSLLLTLTTKEIAYMPVLGYRFNPVTSPDSINGNEELFYYSGTPTWSTGLNIGVGLNLANSISNVENHSTQSSFSPRFVIGYDHNLSAKWKVDANISYVEYKNNRIARSKSYRGYYLEQIAIDKRNVIKKIEVVDFDISGSYNVYARHYLSVGFNASVVRQTSSTLSEETRNGDYYNRESKDVKGVESGLKEFSPGFIFGYQYKLNHYLTMDLSYRKSFNPITNNSIYGEVNEAKLESYTFTLKYYLFK